MDIEIPLNDTYKDGPTSYFGLPLEFLNVLAILSIVANFYVSIVIVKFEKLRKEVTNILLLHMNIVEILFLFATTISTRIFTMLGLDIKSKVSCVTYEVETTLVFCVFLFLIMLTTDWFIKTYSKHKYPRFKRIYNNFVVAIYLLTIIVAYFTTHYCTDLDNFHAFALQIEVAFSLVMIIFVIVMNVIHRVKMRRVLDRNPDNIGLAITNIFMLAWTLVYLAILHAILVDDPDVLADILVVLVTAAVSTCLAVPIFNLIYLYWCDSFKVYLTRAFRCQCNDC